MKTTIALLVCSLFIVIGKAQTITKYSIEPERVFKVDTTVADTSIYIKNLEAPSPDGNKDKKTAYELKQKIEKRYPRKENVKPNKGGKRDTEGTLSIGYSSVANPYNLSVPSDNSMAISDEGIIVSCINTSFGYYDTRTNQKLANGSLRTYASNPTFLTSVYDPKVIYDPKEDRFIKVMLKDYSSVDSNQILIAFSSTNNPMDDWYVYSITGNPFDTTQWSDYPAISITDNELFITVNLIGDSEPWQTGFKQTVIWQVDKNDGYNNQTLDVNLWSDIKFDATNFIRNLHPIRNYNHYLSLDNTTHTTVNNQYFLSNRNLALESDTIFLLEITGDMNSTPTLNIDVLHSNKNYFFPKNGAQKNASDELATNDSRVLGAVVNRNTDQIQFVQHGTDSTTGTVSIYHGTITNVSTSPNCTAVTISDNVKDYGYPNIASTALTPTDNSTIICFNHTSSDDFPGHTAIQFDESGSYSSPILLKEGSRSIQVLPGLVERWGDYSGIQRRYNEPGKVWFEGIFGVSGTYGNWISEIYDEDHVILLPDGISKKSKNVNSKVYPNPVSDIFYFNFKMEKSDNISVDIYDLTGKKVANLFNGYVKEGENLLSLNTSFLAAGSYSIQLRDNQKQIISVNKLLVN